MPLGVAVGAESHRGTRDQGKRPTGGGGELVAHLVVLSEHVLAAAHVAEMEQDMPVADGPEIGTGAVVAGQAEDVTFREGMEILPGAQVARAEEEFSPHSFAAGDVQQRAAGQCIVETVPLPDTRIVDEINGSDRKRLAGQPGRRVRTRQRFPNRAQRWMTARPATFCQFSSSGSLDTATMMPAPRPK